MSLSPVTVILCGMKIKLTSGDVNANVNLHEDGLASDVPAQATDWESALSAPLGLPPLGKCVVPGDRVVIAVDPETPMLTSVLVALWEQLADVDVAELNLTLLLPEDPSDNAWKDLQASLPSDFREQASIHVHDSSDEQQRSYLASSAGGERIYLSQHLIDADLIITVGTIGFDSRLGYKGTNSVIYPAFSDAESIRLARVTGHIELTPDDRRPARDVIDEIGWLLGTQFTIQSVPHTNGETSRLICGAADEVMKAGQQLLRDDFTLDIENPAGLAIVDVSKNEWSSGWKNFGAALTAASVVVEDGGSIAVVADLKAPETTGLQMLLRCSEPDELLKPLSKDPPVDAVETIQLIRTLQRTKVYLLSQLDDDTVDELGMIPLANEAELQRLIDGNSNRIAIRSAHLLWSRLTSTVS